MPKSDWGVSDEWSMYDEPSDPLELGVDGVTPIVVLSALNISAPTDWMNTTTANCILRVPLIDVRDPNNELIHLPVESSSASHVNHSPTADRNSFGLSSEQNIIEFPLHLPYLVEQSRLFRMLFCGTQDPEAPNMVLKSTESKVFRPPWTRYEFHVRRTPYMTSPHGSRPVAWLPVPRPLSLPPLLRHIYYNELDALAEYLRHGPPVESVLEPPIASGSKSRIFQNRARSYTLPIQTLNTLPSMPSTPSPSPSMAGSSIPLLTPSSSTGNVPRRRPPPLSLYNSRPAATWAGSLASPADIRMIVSSENRDTFESRWKDVMLNVHYLGLSVTLRKWLQWLWTVEQPGKPEPVLNGDTDTLLYDVPPVSPRSPTANSSSDEEAARRKAPSPRPPSGKHRRHSSWDRRPPSSSGNRSSRAKSPIAASPRGRSPQMRSPRASSSSYPNGVFFD